MRTNALQQLTQLFAALVSARFFENVWEELEDGLREQ